MGTMILHIWSTFNKVSDAWQTSGQDIDQKHWRVIISQGSKGKQQEYQRQFLWHQNIFSFEPKEKQITFSNCSKSNREIYVLDACEPREVFQIWITNKLERTSGMYKKENKKQCDRCTSTAVQIDVAIIRIFRTPIFPCLSRSKTLVSATGSPVSQRKRGENYRRWFYEEYA